MHLLSKHRGLTAALVLLTCRGLAEESKPEPKPEAKPTAAATPAAPAANALASGRVMRIFRRKRGRRSAKRSGPFAKIPAH